MQFKKFIVEETKPIKKGNFVKYVGSDPRLQGKIGLVTALSYFGLYLSFRGIYGNTYCSGADVHPISTEVEQDEKLDSTDFTDNEKTLGSDDFGSEGGMESDFGGGDFEGGGE